MALLRMDLLCDTFFELIQKSFLENYHSRNLAEMVFNAERFYEWFSTQRKFGVALSVTLSDGKFAFNGITLTCAQIFTCQDFVFRKPISLNLGHTRLHYFACNFHVSETKLDGR